MTMPRIENKRSETGQDWNIFSLVRFYRTLPLPCVCVCVCWHTRNMIVLLAQAEEKDTVGRKVYYYHARVGEWPIWIFHSLFLTYHIIFRSAYTFISILLRSITKSADIFSPALTYTSVCVIPIFFFFFALFTFLIPKRPTFLIVRPSPLPPFSRAIL